MKILFQHRPDQIQIPDEFIELAAAHEKQGLELLELVEHQEGQIQVNDELVEMAIANYRNWKKSDEHPR